ncbi:MAG: DUF883 domain-containing protein [Betaproteobacteria bacterium]|jgi:ElaB/YqjD/DUF883 family membrane-anchored ribosome-binding protein|nr:DUF883 domain-containing protein [Betaproteobacteria bacterium]
MTTKNMELLKKDVQTLITDAQQLFQDASNAGGKQAAELQAQGASLLQQAISDLTAFQQSAVIRGKQFVSSTDQYVHQKPWTAVAVSTGIGILLGMLMARR